MMKKPLAICVLLVATSLQAQVNTEKMRVLGLDSGLAGSVGATVSLERGNSDVTEAGATADFAYKVRRSALFWFNQGSWLYEGDKDLVNKGFSHLRYNLQLQPRWVFEAFGQAQYDRSQDLSHRYLIGAGLRFIPVQRTWGLVAVGVTPMFEFERLTTDENLETVRVSSYVSVAASRKGRYAITSTTYVQPSADRLGNIRVLNETELALSITSFLELTTTVNYRYDAEPPVDVKEYDLSLKQGLRVKF
jgi:hypothetical protein